SLNSNGKQTSWIVEPQLHFDIPLNSSRLKILGGVSFQKSATSRNSILALGFSNNSLLGNLSAATSIIPMEDINEEYLYHAIFGRINLNHKGKYILNLTGRRDGSSRFGPDKRFGNFGAIGLAWILSEENFIIDNLPFLTYGKLRASYGTSGSDEIGNYQYLDTYSFGSNKYGNIIGLYPTRLFNPEYGWEKNNKMEVSLELGIFND